MPLDSHESPQFEQWHQEATRGHDRSIGSGKAFNLRPHFSKYVVRVLKLTTVVTIVLLIHIRQFGSWTGIPVGIKRPINYERNHLNARRVSSAQYNQASDSFEKERESEGESLCKTWQIFDNLISHKSLNYRNCCKLHISSTQNSQSQTWHMWLCI